MTSNQELSKTLAAKPAASETVYPFKIHGVRFNLKYQDGAKYIRQIFRGRRQLLQWRQSYAFMEKMDDSNFTFTEQWSYPINGFVYGYIVDVQPYCKYNTNYVRLGIAIWSDKLLHVRFKPNCSLFDVISRAICQSFDENDFSYDQLLYLPVKMIIETTVSIRGNYSCVKAFAFMSDTEEKDLSIIFKMAVNQQEENEQTNLEEKNNEE